MIGNKCRIESCCKNVTVRGTLCTMHRTRWQKYKTLEPSQKALNRFQPVINGAGYIRINIGGSRVLEHRYVMEEHLGRTLDPDEKVHHINAIKTDNRVENLIVVTQSEHMKKYHCKKGYINEVRDIIINHIAKYKKYRNHQPNCFCGNKPNSKSLCTKHYEMAKKYKLYKITNYINRLKLPLK